MNKFLDELVDDIVTDLAYGEEMDYAASPAQLQRNRRVGLLAQDRLRRVLARQGFKTRQEVGLQPGRRRLDVVAQQSNRRGFIYESKHIDLSRYLTPQGTLDVSRLRTLLNRHIEQVRRYQNSPAILRLNRLRQQRNQPLVRVRLMYQVPEITPRQQAIAFQRLMLSVLSPQRIAGTVIMPRSPAARL